MTPTAPKKSSSFTRYHIFIIAILATIQFTVILDFMVLSPLGTLLIPKLNLTSAQFTFVVSIYAYSASISAFLTAGFADKFDRKKLLLFFYAGFIIGTVMCALATNYTSLLVARIVTGIFGGVIGSIGFAIITDLFTVTVRGRVMGFVQMAFAAAQVLGLPIGFWLANKFDWHYPFWLVVIIAIATLTTIAFYMQPVTEHLKLQKQNPLRHLWKTISRFDYVKAFLATMLLATGGYMLMPLGSTFSTNNLKITNDDLTLLYLITGIFSIISSMIAGKLSDKIGRFTVFTIGTVVSCTIVAIYTQLGATPLWFVILLNVILFFGISTRIVSSQALLSSVPDAKDRGAFMSTNSSIQYLAGALASQVAGLIVYQKNKTAPLENYPVLGYVVIASMLLVLVMMFYLNKRVQLKLSQNAGNS